MEPALLERYDALARVFDMMNKRLHVVPLINKGISKVDSAKPIWTPACEWATAPQPYGPDGQLQALWASGRVGAFGLVLTDFLLLDHDAHKDGATPASELGVAFPFPFQWRNGQPESAHYIYQRPPLPEGHRYIQNQEVAEWHSVDLLQGNQLVNVVTHKGFNAEAFLEAPECPEKLAKLATREIKAKAASSGRSALKDDDSGRISYAELHALLEGVDWTAVNHETWLRIVFAVATEFGTDDTAAANMVAEFSLRANQTQDDADAWQETLDAYDAASGSVTIGTLFHLSTYKRPTREERILALL